jgi:hypothetical protein
MGYEIPPTVIVLLIVLGALFVVCMGYAVYSTFGFTQNGDGIKSMSVAQMEYMAEVRVRNMMALEYEGRAARGYGRRDGGKGRAADVQAERDGDVVYSDGGWSEGGAGVREV